MKNGVVYIVFGTKSTREFKASITTLKRIHPEIHITLLTDISRNNEYVDNEKIIEVDGTRIKQYHLYDSPYDNTLYLDATSGIVGPIMDIFDLMGRFDIAGVHDIVRKWSRHSKIYPDYANIPDGFPEFSGGVLLFRKCKAVENFFKVWQKNYKIWCELSGKRNDQPSLRVSLWQCKDLYLHTLSQEFSIRTKDYHNIVPRIFHFHNMTDTSLRQNLATWLFNNPGIDKLRRKN